MSDLSHPLKLLFVTTEDFYFCSHRLHLAEAALAAGFQVSVATNLNHHRDQIERAGIKVIPTNFERGSMNPITEWQTVQRLTEIYRKERPDIVHHVAMKPVLYGSIAAMRAKVPYVVNALTGMGHLFTDEGLKVQLVRPFVKMMLGFVLKRNNSRLILQNPDDRNFLVQNGMIHQKQTKLIRGAGVDIHHFKPVVHKRKEGEPMVVTCVARMLKEKGVMELIEAARVLKNNRKRDVVIRLVGDVDHENPSSLTKEDLKTWHKEGLIDWQGHRNDVDKVWAESDIAILPSYREGLPKSLLEAASCGKPMIATDVPGCREVVRPDLTGILVPVKSPSAIANAIEKLIQDPDLCLRYGRNARHVVEEEFANEVVDQKTLDLYRALAG